LLHHRNRFSLFLKALIFLVSSFFISLIISRNFFDLSYDGQAYHQEAIIQLYRGWNPFYEQLTSSDCNNMHRWLNHYSKGVWFYVTILFAATKDIEAGKLFHLWLMMASFLTTLSFLRRVLRFPRLQAFIISFLVAFNPVSIYQSLSFYLDGQLMSLMVIFIVALAFIFRESKRFYYYLLGMATIVLINIKLTAGIYAGLIIIGFIGILWATSRLEQLRKTLIWILLSFFLGFVLIGFNPYVTNTLYKGNPFYPALGTDRSDYTFPQFPANFIGKNSFTLLFYSIFSKSDNVRGPEKRAYLKIPFTISKEELNAFTDTNAKQGGFGPLFSGAILFSFLIIILALFSLHAELKKKRTKNFISISKEHSAEQGFLTNIYLGLFCLALLLTTCLINPASSLARFIPQMWLFPIISVLLAYSLKKKFVRFIGHLILLIMILNNFLIGYVYYSYNLSITNLYNKRLQKLAVESQLNPLHFYFGHFLSSNTLRFNRFGIIYEVVQKREDCYQGQRILPHSVVMKCAPK
ncbi:MAG: hypothetical protein ACP5Q3_11810, partial [bacterium]